jgi:hypothetical protein
VLVVEGKEAGELDHHTGECSAIALALRYAAPRTKQPPSPVEDCGSTILRGQLLFLRSKLAIGPAQLVGHRERDTLSIGGNGHAGDTDHLAIALICFFNCVLVDSLH